MSGSQALHFLLSALSGHPFRCWGRVGERMERREACLTLPSPAPFCSRKNPLWPSIPDPAHSSLGSWVPTVTAEVRTPEEEGHGAGGVGPGSKRRDAPLRMNPQVFPSLPSKMPSLQSEADLSLHPVLPILKAQTSHCEMGLIPHRIVGAMNQAKSKQHLTCIMNA